VGGHDGSSLLMRTGRDAAILLGSTSQALCRMDEHGWLALSGEASADLNMVFVSRACPREDLGRYVDEVEARHVDAILMVDEGAPQLVEAAEARGLLAAGRVPVMAWQGTSLPGPDARNHVVRLAAENDINDVNAAMAEAFALDEAAVQRSMPPSLVSAGADVWIVEDGGTIAGSGTFIRSGDHVGIYCMATRPQFQRQGIGRAVLDAAMRHYLGEGVTTFTLEATAAGVRLYEQVGFETVAQPSVFVIGSSTQFPT
jgi:GNAT superfamily N-acetyltransferase